MNAEQLLEFLEQHIDELPHLMGEEAWQAFQAVLHTSVQQMREGISLDELETAVQPISDHLVRCPQVREKLRAFRESASQRCSQPPDEPQRLGDAPADTTPSEQRVNQVANRYRVLAHTRAAAADEKSDASKRHEPDDRRPR